MLPAVPSLGRSSESASLNDPIQQPIQQLRMTDAGTKARSSDQNAKDR